MRLELARYRKGLGTEMEWAIGIVSVFIGLWLMFKLVKEDDKHEKSLDENFDMDEQYEDTHSIEDGED